MKYLVITVACLVSVAGCGKSDTDYNSGANQRIIRMVEVQRDPMSPPRFK